MESTNQQRHLKESPTVAFQGVFQNSHGLNSALRLEMAVSVLNSGL